MTHFSSPLPSTLYQNDNYVVPHQ